MTQDRRLQAALDFAAAKHEGQFRLGGEPYIRHPMAVAQMLRQQGYDTEHQIAALFHDLLEDTDASPEQLELLGGSRVLRAVETLTKRDGVSMADYMAGIRSDPMATAVKIADRLHNLRCAADADPAFRRRYILDTVNWYLDLSPEIPAAVRALADTLDVPIFRSDRAGEPMESDEMQAGSFVLRGDICWSPGPDRLQWLEDGYLVCTGGVCRGVFPRLPEEYGLLPVHDHRGRLIFPGLVDLHIHAPQFAFRGMGMDMELMQWLQEQTFPEEEKYSDLLYADRAYSLFAEAMAAGATTHACIFATKHRRATELLMDKLERTGLVTYVGKVNMDREAPAALCEPGADYAAFDTFGWINHVANRYRRTFPILTPRFIPCCSDALMEQLRQIRRTYDLPIQSHLSESLGEIDFVRSLRPDADFYGDAYDDSGLFGREHTTGALYPAIMAHCVHSSPEEIRLIKQNGVFVAHCPASNINLSSGIAPIRRYLRQGLRVGLGSDVAGGHSPSMLRAVCDAVQVSKLHWRLTDRNDPPLTFPEAFHLATRGGGAFFGRVGSFEDGFSFSAVVLDDSSLRHPFPLTPDQRLERAAYGSADLFGITAKYVGGEKIYENDISSGR